MAAGSSFWSSWTHLFLCSVLVTFLWQSAQADDVYCSYMPENTCCRQATRRDCPSLCGGVRCSSTGQVIASRSKDTRQPNNGGRIEFTTLDPNMAFMYYADESAADSNADKKQRDCGVAPNYKPCVTVKEANLAFKTCCNRQGFGSCTNEVCKYDLDPGQILRASRLRGPCAQHSFADVMQCGADDRDNRQCCRAKNIQGDCLALCNPSTFDGDIKMLIFQCARSFEKIMSCHQAALEPEAVRQTNVRKTQEYEEENFYIIPPASSKEEDAFFSMQEINVNGKTTIGGAQTTAQTQAVAVTRRPVTTLPPYRSCGRPPNFEPCIAKFEANNRFRACCRSAGLGECAEHACNYDLTGVKLAKYSSVFGGACKSKPYQAIFRCANQISDNRGCCNLNRVAAFDCDDLCSTSTVPASNRAIRGRIFFCGGAIKNIMKCAHSGLT